MNLTELKSANDLAMQLKSARKQLRSLQMASAIFIGVDNKDRWGMFPFSGTSFGPKDEGFAEARAMLEAETEKRIADLESALREVGIEPVETTIADLGFSVDSGPLTRT